MSRIRANFLGGTIGADVSAVATTLTSSQLANFPVVTAPDYGVIVLDPDGVFGNPEIVYLTAHTSTSGSGTISRGQEGTVARQHLAVNSVQWRHSATVTDWALNATYVHGAGRTTGNDSDFSTPPVDGTIYTVKDDTSTFVYLTSRSGGTWYSVRIT